MSFDNEEFRKLNGEVRSLKPQVDSLNSEKESWFKKKEDLKVEINDLIRKIKQIKAESDKKNIDINELKKQRDKHSSEAKSLIKKVRNINNEKANALKKFNIKIDPSQIQEQINHLEKRVETEVDFEKEKKLMEEIKKLKRVFGESSEVMTIAKEAEQIELAIKDSKKKANEFHKKIMHAVKDVGYDQFIQLSTKINSLKKEQENAFQMFIESKKKFIEINRDYKEKAERLEMFRLVFSKDKKMKIAIKEENNNEVIERNSQQVEAKLKSMKRITTEDLLKIQGDIAE